MASDVAAIANRIVGGEDYTEDSTRSFPGYDISLNTMASIVSADVNLRESSSSYLLANNQSELSRNIDRWMNGDNDSAIDNSQEFRRPELGRSFMNRASSMSVGMWYLLAMVLPLFNVSPNPELRCTPSLFLHTADLFITSLQRVLGYARMRIQQIAQEREFRDLLATAMDIVLVVYAIGFLVLSMYQASVSA